MKISIENTEINGVKVISELDNGDCFMVQDQDSRIFYAQKGELESDSEGTKKVKTLPKKFLK